MAADTPEQGKKGRLSGLLAAPQVEKYGVDQIDESERTATPWSFFSIMMGSNTSLGVVLFGWIPVTLGLSLWDSLTSMMVGTLIGAFILAPLIVIGSRTATNNATSSGAHFGVRGRMVGSIVSLSIAIVYTAIAVWTGADAMLGSLNRMFGLPYSTPARAVAYAVLTVLITLVAIYGFKLLLRAETALWIAGSALMLLAVVAFAGRFTLDFPASEYVLAGRWQTWMLSALAVGVAGPMSLAGLTGDWSRYISPERYPARKLLPPALAATFLGMILPQLLGLFTAITFSDPFAPYVDGLVAASPDWYVPFILVLGLIGSGGLAVSTAYSCGLDLEAIIPQLSRVKATVFTSLLAAGLVYLGSLVFDLADSVISVSIILLALSTPWAVVTGIGFGLAKGRYRRDDLQVFNRGQKGGIYWFWHGFNFRAVTAWAIGATFGILACNTTLYVGPLADVANGVDVSFIGAAVIGATIYLLLRLLFPEGDRLQAAAPTILEHARVKAVSSDAS